MPGKAPTYAILPGVGRVRILYVEGSTFTVLDRWDTERRVKRERLTFLPETPPKKR